MFEKLRKQKESESEKEHSQYVPPAIITYNGDDLIEELGPAYTCVANYQCPVDGPPSGSTT